MKNAFAYHFDLKLPMWKRSYMDEMVERLAVWGYNTIVYELEDKFQFSKYPSIQSPDAPSKEETADFVASCRTKGVEVIPLMQTLGHADYVLAKPEYAHLRETTEVTNQYDPLSDEAKGMICEMMDEIIEVFQPRDFFHMGGDETWNLGKSAKCAGIVDKIGVGGLYLKHMLPLFKHLVKRGLRPIIWADIALTHPEIIKQIPKEVLLMDWDYSTQEERPDNIVIWGGNSNEPGWPHAKVTWEQYCQNDFPDFKKHLEQYAVDEQTKNDGTFRQFYCTDAILANGFDVILASSNRSSGDMIGVSASRHLPNCFYGARKGMEKAGGNLVTSWAARHNHPELGLLGAFAASFALRNRDPFNLDSLCEAFTAEFYGISMPEFAQAVKKAQVNLKCAQAMFLSKARKRLKDGFDPMRELVWEIVETKFDDRIQAVEFLEEVVSGYKEAIDTFSKMKTKATRNARNLDFWIEGTELEMFYANILLAALKGELKKYAENYLEKLNTLRRITHSLFAETYSTSGIKLELDQRYGFYEEFQKNIR